MSKKEVHVHHYHHRKSKSERAVELHSDVQQIHLSWYREDPNHPKLPPHLREASVKKMSDRTKLLYFGTTNVEGNVLQQKWRKFRVWVKRDFMYSEGFFISIWILIALLYRSCQP